jgi:hypothetical protein
MVVKITEKNSLANSIFKVIWFVAVFNSLFLVYLPYYEESVKCEQILSDFIDSSKDINANVTLAENEAVTIFLDVYGLYPGSEELLKIVVIDPENRKYSWEENISGSTTKGFHENHFSFTPKASGVHHIEISNAIFETDIRVVSGMVNLYEQPSFVTILFLSLVVTLTGLFSIKKKAVMKQFIQGK